eukprot:110717-Hanusia_phi.AAC.1
MKGGIESFCLSSLAFVVFIVWDTWSIYKQRYGLCFDGTQEGSSIAVFRMRTRAHRINKMTETEKSKATQENLITMMIAMFMALVVASGIKVDVEVVVIKCGMDTVGHRL